MQNKHSFKFYNKILCIFILSIVIYMVFGIVPKLTIKSNAATYTYSKASNNLPSNFNNTYPGYTSLLQSLAKSHPNWTFKLYETGLDWDTVINNEYTGHGKSPKNLVPSSYESAWICSICGKKEYDDSGRWYCASRAAIEYVMDPRNSINEAKIFQFLQLANDKNITKAQVKTMASKISYLNSDDIINAIYEVATEDNINPFYIIGKILQEQGSGASALCSGNGYNGKYKGYYNLFNIGASGNGTSEIILNGLEYAYEKGWNTPEKALRGGLATIKNYINRGQDTLYYQKFNVTYKPYYNGQYAQNIFDSQSIASNLKKYYNEEGLLESKFTFEIPLYKNMPTSAVKSPSINTETGEIAYINANGGLALRDAPNGSTIAYVNEGEQVLITKRATEKIGGYYWDKVSTPQGTGYMAREAKDGSKTYLVVIGEQKAYETEGTQMFISPNTKISAIDGATNSSSYFGTGSKIKLAGKTYTLVMLGDVSGDGEISATDYVKIKNRIMGTNKLSGAYKEAADVNRDGKISATDYVKVKNQIMGSSSISL